ncbi:hypothetical protein UlMin_011291, partial [Ulmus minor]
SSASRSWFATSFDFIKGRYSSIFFVFVTKYPWHYCFEKPSVIQRRGIVPFCQGLDVIQQAQSRTGKTLDYSLVQCQALVLAPTRELAQQIEKVMWELGDYLGVKFHACWCSCCCWNSWACL